QREHLVLVDQLLARLRRHGGVVAVVFRDQLELAAVHTAFLVHRVEVGLDAVAHLDAELRGRAGKHRRLADQDLVGGHAGRALCTSQGRQQRAERGDPRKLARNGCHHVVSSHCHWPGFRNCSCWTRLRTSSSRQRPPASSSYSALTQPGCSPAGGRTRSCAGLRRPSERSTSSAAALRSRSPSSTRRARSVVSTLPTPRNQERVSGTVVIGGTGITSPASIRSTSQVSVPTCTPSFDAERVLSA